MIKKRYKRNLLILLVVSVISTCFYTEYYFNNEIPESICLTTGEKDHINLRLPVDGTVTTDCKEVVLTDQHRIPSNQVHMVLNEPFSIYSETTGNYELRLKLFGLFEIKNIAVEVVEPEYLTPCGIPVGIYLESDGILVIGTSELTSYHGVVSEPALDIIKTGDYIVEINNTPVSDKETLIQMINENGDKEVILTIRRDGELIPVRLHPVNTAPKEYKLGLWVRDDTQGIGTLTYVDDENHFGALGHGISDSDTNLLVQVSKGTLYETDIRTIIKGTAGNPGSLSGVICYGDENCYGQIDSNTTRGIFGSVNEKLLKKISSEKLPIGYKQEVHTGPATIRCTVDGVTGDYGIEILEVNTSNNNDNKGIVLKVTDESLLQKTGGIVQGMSGSPILQDGKIIGAVTHVFIQDSTKGYGIFIEDMK